MDMFWGDRCGTVVNPEGYTWMVATHIAEPTPQEMKKRRRKNASQPVGTPSAPECIIQVAVSLALQTFQSGWTGRSGKMRENSRQVDS